MLTDFNRSVATSLRCGGIFKTTLLANLLVNLSVQDFLKSVSIWQSYRQKSSVLGFLAHSVIVVVLLTGLSTAK